MKSLTKEINENISFCNGGYRPAALFDRFLAPDIETTDAGMSSRASLPP
jgi:hypothetical protein